MKEVTVIKPIENTRKTRLAAYCRVSSSSDEQEHSFQAQLKHYENITAYYPDSELIDIYADEGITGTSLKKRDEFLRMMYDARQHRFDRILVKSVTRFGRNLVDSLEALRELKRLGISVFFEQEHLDTGVIQGEILETLLFSAAQMESEKKSLDIKRAYQMRVSLRSVKPNSAPSGFELKDGNLISDEMEAQVKCYMKDLYLDGNGYGKIAEILNEKEMYLKQGTKWEANLVACALQNEKNYGDTVLCKSITTGFPFKRSINKDISKRILVEDTHEGIFTKEEAEKMKSILEYQQEKYRCKSHAKSTYPFSSKLRCEYCGKNLKRRIKHKGKPYEAILWSCPVHHKKAEDCELIPVNEKEIEQAFMCMFNKLKMSCDYVLVPMVEQMNHLKMTIVDRKESEQISEEIININRQSLALARCRAEEEIDAAFYYAQETMLNKQLGDLKEKRSKIIQRHESCREKEKTKSMIELLRRYQGVMIHFEDTWFKAIVKSTQIKNETITFELVNGLKLTERREKS